MSKRASGAFASTGTSSNSRATSAQGKLNRSTASSSTKVGAPPPVTKRKTGSGKAAINGSSTSLSGAGNGSRVSLSKSQSASRGSVRSAGKGGKLLGGANEDEQVMEGGTLKSGMPGIENVNEEPAILPELPPKVEIDAAAAAQMNEEAAYRQRLQALPIGFEQLRRGLSILSRSPDGLRQVYTKLSLPNTSLTDISFLNSYPYIQVLELPGNNITSTTPLSPLKYLTHLDLSNNKLTRALECDPPYNLQYVDLSKNLITDMEGLERHRFLTYLCLDRNLIRNMTSLTACKHLTHLSIRSNNLLGIYGLDDLPLKVLDLSYNRIDSLRGLASLDELQELYLSHNAISDLSILILLKSLRTLDLTANDIPKLDSIRPLHSLPLLRDLSLTSNPLTTSTDSYRPRSVFYLSQLTVLDALPVSAEEKVAAKNVYDPPPSVVASVEHAGLLKKQIAKWAAI
ncbi:hypothetical protein DFS34DRAFT_323839 [Phlyctochytrium arcticum]|nr:hypothetical protein DFS34DRAFT_323839 [Phlyctochytrium arcticum]